MNGLDRSDGQDFARFQLRNIAALGLMGATGAQTAAMLSMALLDPSV
jgi:hypothetical protein